MSSACVMLSAVCFTKGAHGLNCSDTFFVSRVCDIELTSSSSRVTRVTFHLAELIAEVEAEWRCSMEMLAEMCSILCQTFEEFAGEESTGQGSQVNTGLHQAGTVHCNHNGSGPCDPWRVMA